MSDLPSDGPVIELVELTKIFKDFWNRPKVAALQGVDLTVRRGEVLGLLGPNGSGKTTTIRLILGLLFPTRGIIRVLGFPPRHVKAKEQIGYLPEESHLYQYLTAEEALHFYGRLFHLSSKERQRRIESLLQLVGLVGARNRPIREYSKGMARRLGLAQALINDPELLILDEPTAGLDPVGNREFKDLILSLKERGKTIFLSSHLLADVEDACDRIAVLYGGRICMEGNVSDLLARKDATQIQTGKLSKQTLREIRELIVQREGELPVHVDVPKETLEGLFLRAVAEAREKRLSTSGAGQGQLGGFLAGEEFQPGSKEATHGPQEEHRKEDHSVIDDLVRGE